MSYLCGMEKIYGASERRDGIQQIGRKRWEVFYGFGMDGGTGYNYRQTLDYKPTVSEVKQLIIDTINANTDEKILNGFVWKGIHVYLSSENQNNFKAAFDLNMQMGGAMLPIKFKLGEDAEGMPCTIPLKTWRTSRTSTRLQSPTLTSVSMRAGQKRTL